VVGFSLPRNTRRMRSRPRKESLVRAATSQKTYFAATERFLSNSSSGISHLRLSNTEHWDEH